MVETAEKTIDQGLNVRIKRTSKRMTQTELAELMNISSQKLSDIEKKAVIDDKTLNLIAEKLDTDVNWFKTYDPNGMEGYNTSSNINTNSPTDSSQIQGLIGSNTIINNPLKEVIELTQMTLADIKEFYEREIKLREELHQKDLRIALLEQEKKLTGKQ